MPLLVFGLWTLFVWATRIGTVLGDDALTGADKAARLVLVASFVAVGAVALVGWWRARRGPLTPAEGTAVRAAVVWTSGVWIVRAVQISLADHDGAFIAVHVVLGLVSVALGLWVWRSGTLPSRHGTAGDRRAEAHVTP